jgi:hypothetical protein
MCHIAGQNISPATILIFLYRGVAHLDTEASRLSSTLLYGKHQCNLFYCKKKGKAVPLQAWGGPEGSRKLRFPDFLTTALDGGKVISHTHRPHLPPGNTPGTHFC